MITLLVYGLSILLQMYVLFTARYTLVNLLSLLHVPCIHHYDGLNTKYALL